MSRLTRKLAPFTIIGLSDLSPRSETVPREGPRLMKDRSLTLDLRHEHSARLKHERVKDHLLNEMLAGRLKPGQALPSLHSLEKMFGVARMTVCQAMTTLENDGLIRRVQGKGTFVEDGARRKLKRGLDLFALVVPETRGGFYPSLLHGFEAAAREIPHQTIICNTENEVPRQGDIVLQLIDKQVGGVAMVPCDQAATPAHQIRQLQKHGIPVVFCHRRVEGVPAPLLSLPFREVGHSAGKALVEQGHRRVMIFDSHQTPTSNVIEEAMNSALRAGGCDLPCEVVSVGESIVLTEKAVLAAIKKAFAKPDRPTAVFATFDSLAEMIYLLLPQLGLRVPQDVSLLGFGGAWRDGIVTQRLVSVVIDEGAVGQRAVSLLHEMRQGDRSIDENAEFVLELSLSEGETLAKAASGVS